jgi:hypothetical protein
VYFAKKTQTTTEYPVEMFLDEFCFGTAEHEQMRRFDVFTTRVEEGKIEWPMCFAKVFLRRAGELQLYHRINDAENAVNLPQIGTGLEWEYIARVAVGIIARCTGFRDLSPHEAQVHIHTSRTCTCTCTHMHYTHAHTHMHTYTQVIGMPEETGCRPKLTVMSLPSDIDEPADAHTEINNLNGLWKTLRLFYL